MKISLMAATDTNRLIGNDGELPWHIPEDLKRFRERTLHKPLIMGRKTYESIGTPLDQRKNIVLTKQDQYQAEGCHIVHSEQEALEVAGVSGEIMVIGGESIFRAFLPRSDRLYLTIIHETFSGDTYFPELKPDSWSLMDRLDIRSTGDPPAEVTYCTLLNEKQSWKKNLIQRDPPLPEFLKESLCKAETSYVQ